MKLIQKISAVAMTCALLVAPVAHANQPDDFVCQLAGNIAYEAMENYQGGKKEKAALSALKAKFVTPLKESQAQEVLTKMVDMAVKTTYHSDLPIGKDKTERQEFTQTYAQASYQGCKEAQ